MATVGTLESERLHGAAKRYPRTVSILQRGELLGDDCQQTVTVHRLRSLTFLGLAEAGSA